MANIDLSIIPQVLNDYAVYDGNGDKLIGVTNDMTLADIVSKTVEMNGAGMDDIEVVVIGMYNSITQEIPLNTPYSQLIKYLDTTKNAVINVRGAIQVEDKGTGETKFLQFRYMVSGKAKQLTPGNAKRGETFGSKISIAVRRVLMEIAGETVIDIDKLNGKVVVDGKDITQAIRKMC